MSIINDTESKYNKRLTGKHFLWYLVLEGGFFKDEAKRMFEEFADSDEYWVRMSDEQAWNFRKRVEKMERKVSK